jgi:hypothetical protein
MILKAYSSKQILAQPVLGLHPLGVQRRGSYIGRV